MKVKIVKNATARSAEVKRLSSRSAAPDEKTELLVKSILKDISENGLKAVEEYAKKFDGLKGKLKMTARELSAAADNVKPAIRTAIRHSIRNVKNFHKQQKESSWTIKGKHGETIGQRVRPLNRVGVYVPGGAGVYPSTVIMAVVPAIVAGVKEIVVTTPAGDGLHPAVACALKELGVSEIYRIGGAQAVGLLAYGAGKIKPVDKIVGPANVYAAYAKKEVFGIVDIDMIAGPSEIAVMADETADPDWVAADILSQAEHGSGHEAAVCVTTSMQQAEWIQNCLQQQVESSPKKEILEKSLSQYGRILVVKDWDVGVDVINALAPEHLEIVTQNAKELSKRIENAGAIFIGPWSSEPVGDYMAGPNHTLPTNGTARFFSPLGVYDYIKRTSIIEYNSKAVQAMGKHIANLADEEGFFHHAEAIRKRI